MFLGRKNQYCENDYTTRCNLQIQCDLYQITNGILHRTRRKNFIIHMETQKIPNTLGKKKNFPFRFFMLVYIARVNSPKENDLLDSVPHSFFALSWTYSLI